MDFSVFQNLDLLFVGIAVAAISILSFAVFVNDRKNITSRSFLLFSLVTILWSMVNYAQYQIHEVNVSFWILRGVIFFGVWHAFSFFQLAYVFPRAEVKFSKSYKFILIPAVILVSALTLTPYVFLRVAEISSAGQIIRVENGSGIAVFGGLVVFLILIGILRLFVKAFKKFGEEQERFRFMLWGVFLTFALLITFNFILPAFADNPSFIPLGPVFLLPFVFFTFYSISRHKLFNVKVLSTEVIVFFLILATFSEVLLSKSLGEIIFRIIIFSALLLISLLLIRSVLEEVKAREELAKLDAAKSEFISLAGHQLRAPLTAIKGYSSMLLEGSFGVVADKAKTALERIFTSSDLLTRLVSELLDLSRIESGKIRYDFKKIKLEDIVARVTDELDNISKTKNIKIEFHNENKNKLAISGDPDKIHEVVINLLDNAFKYSNEGPILVSLKPVGPMLRLAVKDKGFGIPEEEFSKLFVKFGRTEVSKKERPDGMGLGLYFVKKIVEDHEGRIWVESPGLGKGSTFFVELPVA